MSSQSTHSSDKSSPKPEHTDSGGGGGFDGEYAGHGASISSYLNNSSDTPPDPQTVLHMQSTLGNQSTLRLLNRKTSDGTINRKTKEGAYPFSGLRMVQRTAEEPLTTPFHIPPMPDNFNPNYPTHTSSSNTPVIQRRWVDGDDNFQWDQVIDGVTWFAESAEVMWFQITNENAIVLGTLESYKQLEGQRKSWAEWDQIKVAPYIENSSGEDDVVEESDENVVVQDDVVEESDENVVVQDDVVEESDEDVVVQDGHLNVDDESLSDEDINPRQRLRERRNTPIPPPRNQEAQEELEVIEELDDQLDDEMSDDVDDTPNISQTSSSTAPKKSFWKRHPMLTAGLKAVRNFLILPYVQAFNLGQGIGAAIAGDKEASTKYLGLTAGGKLWAATFGAGKIRNKDEATMFGEDKGKRAFGKWLVDLKELAKEVAAWATFIALVTGVIGIFAPPFQAVATVAGTVAAISAAVMAGLSLINVIYDAIMIKVSDNPKQKAMLKWKLGKDIIDVLVGVGSAVIGGIGGITAFDASGASGVGQVIGGNTGALVVGMEGDVKDALYDDESDKEVESLDRKPDLTLVQREGEDSTESEKLMAEIDQHMEEKEKTVNAVKTGVDQDSTDIASYGESVTSAKQKFDKDLAPAFDIPTKSQEMKEGVESNDPEQDIKKFGKENKNMDDSKLTEIDQKLDEVESKTGEQFDGGERPKEKKPSTWSRFKSWFKNKFNFIKKRIKSLFRKVKMKITAGIMKAMGMDAPIKQFADDLNTVAEEKTGLEKANREGKENVNEAGEKLADIKKQLADVKDKMKD